MSRPTPGGQHGRPPARGSWWGIAGIVLACFVTVAGLAVLGFVIWVFVALGSFGGNK